MSKKTESIQEFLARGGKITLCPTNIPEKKDKVNVRSTTAGPAVILSYEDADYYYGEKKEKPAKPQKASKAPSINLDSLPEDFRKKLGL